MTLPDIEGYNVGKHPMVTRLLKGVFNKRPPKKKLGVPWSVDKVLATLKSWGEPKHLSLKLLSWKTTMLLALATAKRMSSLALLSVAEGHMAVGENSVILLPSKNKKHSRPGHIIGRIKVDRFEDIELDPVAHLKEYLSRTEGLPVGTRLLIITQKPFTRGQKSYRC